MDWQEFSFKSNGQSQHVYDENEAGALIAIGVVTPDTVVTAFLASGKRIRTTARQLGLDFTATETLPHAKSDAIDDLALVQAVPIPEGSQGRSEPDEAATNIAALPNHQPTVRKTSDEIDRSDKPAVTAHGQTGRPSSHQPGLTPTPFENLSARPVPKPDHALWWVLTGAVLVIVITIGLYGAWAPEKRWITIDTPVYEQADSSSVTAALIARGEKVTVTEVGDDTKWLKLEDTQFAGQFILAATTSATEPPSLDRNVARTVAAFRRLALLKEPANASAVVGWVEVGTDLIIVGQVLDGASPQPWIEVVANDGGAAYVAASDVGLIQTPTGWIFQRRGRFADQLPPAIRPEEPVIVNAAPVPAPRQRNVPPACANINGTKIELCVAAQRRFRALQAAYSTSPRGGERPELTLNTAINMCWTARCVDDRLSARIAELEQIAQAPQAIQIPPVDRSRPMRPRGRESDWITGDDYPSSAIREGAQGTTATRLTVGTDGRVIACEVTSTSGNAALDQAACRNLQRRARFEPALDSAGNPIVATYTKRVNWRLPDN